MVLYKILSLRVFRFVNKLYLRMYSLSKLIALKNDSNRFNNKSDKKIMISRTSFIHTIFVTFDYGKILCYRN